MPVNILQLHSSAGFYGAETVIINLSKAINQTDTYHSIVGCLADTLHEKPELGKVAVSLNLDTVYLPMQSKLDFSVLTKIGETIRKKNIKILHAHGYKSNLIGLLASKLQKVPIITTNHLFPPMPLEDKKLQFYSRFDASLIMKRLNKVVAVSEKIKLKLINKGIDESKLVVIENGIDLNDYNNNQFNKLALKKSLNINDSSFVVGSLGRLTAQKGYNYLLKAAKKILSNKIPVVFLIAGDGPLRVQLQEDAKKLNISENVKFIGFRKDTINLLGIFDIFVLSSIDEGLPMAMLEAMASHIPVLVTSVGDIPRVIVNNKNGILIEPNNSDLLADKIVYLLNNQSLRDELVINGLDTVNCYHSKEAMCKKYLDIYNHLL